MLSGMQRQFTEMMENLSRTAQQPPLPGGAGTMVDVLEHDTDVVVVADLPGVERGDITVRLLDPRTLRIAARREEASEKEQTGYHMRERRIGSLSRTVSLPTDVKDEGAGATFKNGTLEVRLKKAAEARGEEIPVGGPAGQSVAQEHRQQIEEEYREDREKMRPSGYRSRSDLMEEAQKIKIEEKGDPDEQKKAAELRRQKERMYEEGKKTFR
jgi:HSP20 family protein